MTHYKLLDIRLDLFDGTAGAAPAGGGEGGGQAAGAPAEAAVYGRQENGQGNTSASGTQGNGTAARTGTGEETGPQGIVTEQRTPEERRRAFREMVRGEYKDIYTEETQRMLNRRYAETQDLQKRVDSYQPLIDVLAQRYGVDGADPARLAKAVEDDSALWADAAEKAGMTVEQYKGFQRLQRENAQLLAMQRRQQGQQQMNAQLQRWYQEGEATRAKYKDFDFATEAQNPEFLSMLRAGVPVEHAYKVLHMDRLMSDAMTTAAQQTERAVTENVKARGTRPKENGTGGSAAAFTVKDDVSKLSKQDIKNILKQIEEGKTISFG